MGIEFTGFPTGGGNNVAASAFHGLLPEQELNLKPCPVLAQNVQRCTAGIGAEQPCGIDIVFFFSHDIDNAQHALERWAINDAGIDTLTIPRSLPV